MIDIHNHILPAWDDGPETLVETLKMARQAVSVGTKVMVATPHRTAYGNFSSTDIVSKMVESLNKNLQQEGIDLEIIPGVEIPIADTVVEEVSSGVLRALGSGNTLLIEPPFPNLPSYLLPSIEKIFANGYRAVLAHPERNAIVQKEWKANATLSFPSECIERGCTIQLTSGSIVGRFGATAQEICRAVVLNHGWSIVIASDSHDAEGRSPLFLRDAAEQVAEWIGDRAAAFAMVESIPQQIIGR